MSIVRFESVDKEYSYRLTEGDEGFIFETFRDDTLVSTVFIGMSDEDNLVYESITSGEVDDLLAEHERDFYNYRSYGKMHYLSAFGYTPEMWNTMTGAFQSLQRTDAVGEAPKTFMALLEDYGTHGNGVDHTWRFVKVIDNILVFDKRWDGIHSYYPEVE